MDSSTDSAIELTNFQHELCSIKESLQAVVKKPDLDNALNNIVKKGDIESIVTTIVTKLIDNFKKEIDQKLTEKTQE